MSFDIKYTSAIPCPQEFKVSLLDSSATEIYADDIVISESTSEVFTIYTSSYLLPNTYNNCSYKFQCKNNMFNDNALIIKNLDINVYRSSSVNISPQGLHFQIGANKYIRLDENGLNINNANIQVQSINAQYLDNYLTILKNQQSGQFDMFGGNPDFQYIKIHNRTLQISSSKFLLSSSGQLIINGGGSGVSKHNDLTGLQGSGSDYYHLNEGQYNQLRSFFVSTSQPDPSLGSTGDIWLVYQE